MSDPERQPLLSRSPVVEPSRRRSLGCLLAISFLQFISTNGILSYIYHDFNLFHLEVRQAPGVLVGAAVLFYTMPVCIGLYADVIVGKYTTLFFGLCLKALASLLSFVVVLCLYAWQEEVDAIALNMRGSAPLDSAQLIQLKFLVASLSASVVMFLAGISMIVPSVLTLGSQQINQQTESQASFIRWVLMAVSAGTIIEYFLLSNYDIYMPHTPLWLLHHPQIVRHAANVTLDALSLAVFLFGKRSYIKRSPAEGLRSLTNLVQIVRNRITCLSSRRHYDTNDTSLRMRTVQDVVNSCTLERLRIRKAVITIPLFSVVAVSVVTPYAFHLVTDTNVSFFNQGEIRTLNLVRNIQLAVFLPIVPLMELAIRKCRHPLWQNNLVNLLKTLGFGMLLNVVSPLTTGVIASIMPNRDLMGISSMYVLPQNIIFGLASFLTYSAIITFWLTECPTGLSTFVAAIGVNFSFLAFPLFILLKAAVDLKNMVPYTDIVCYVYAGILLAMLVLIYIPVAIWYVRASRAIDIALKEQEDSETNDQARSGHIET
ncbi:uncharacterized protein LOC135499889 [Lineus longissimus]|uniref:uncharacterized protein LOC135499889 n=1 Tax=Lineus longissimus TaxID=88925 RepID=UPI00315CF609